MSEFRCTRCGDKPKAETAQMRCGNCGAIFEQYEGRWQQVVDSRRVGWWRFNEHYDRNGYCDNPARGY